MYKSLNHDRPHRFWCLQEPLIPITCMQLYGSCNCIEVIHLNVSTSFRK